MTALSAAHALRRFRRDESGVVAMMFGLSVIPLCLLAGAALDYSRGAREKAALNAALDATALALAQDARRLTVAELQTKGQDYFDAVLHAQGGGAARLSVSVDPSTQRLSLSAAVTNPTTLMRLAGMSSMRVASTSTVSYGSPKIEVALVLDNTGSMSQVGKMDALKAAATSFVGQLAAKARGAGDIKVSITPFSTTVRTDVANAGASWLDFSAVAPASWTGCVADRVQPWDVTVTAGALHPAVPCPSYESRLTRMIGLTDVLPTADRAALTDRIAALTPTGNTNITIGLSWGLASVTAGSQVPGAAAAGGDVRKFVVLLTDGDNTQNAFTTDPTQINARTSAACATVKASGATLYTIRVIAGNATLLRACATSPAHYYEAADASQIQPAFQSILDSILRVRLTS